MAVLASYQHSELGGESTAGMFGRPGADNGDDREPMQRFAQDQCSQSGHMGAVGSMSLSPYASRWFGVSSATDAPYLAAAALTG